MVAHQRWSLVSTGWSTRRTYGGTPKVVTCLHWVEHGKNLWWHTKGGHLSPLGGAWEELMVAHQRWSLVSTRWSTRRTYGGTPKVVTCLHWMEHGKNLWWHTKGGHLSPLGGAREELMGAHQRWSLVHTHKINLF